MGRATRWLRNLWGGKKENKESRDYSNYAAACAGEDDRKEKKRWSFTKSARDHPGDIAAPRRNEPSTAAVEAAWFRSFYAEDEKEQNKHAIAVAAATAAAADAAVAAAQAAVAVVRLTSQGRAATAPVFVSASTRQRMAAVKIQTAFRGYLAKKALRALKALVKLQALVRGYLVRKQATATLRSMQALIRAQATVRPQRNRTLLPHGRRCPPEVRPRRSLDRSDETRSEHPSSFHNRRLSGCLDGFDRSPKIVEMDTCRPRSRSSRRSSTVLDTPEDSNSNSNSIPSPLPCQIPARITVPDCQNFQDYDWCLDGEKCRFPATAQSTPRYLSSRGNRAVTPAKSVCGVADGAFRRFSNDLSCPGYMASTQSFEAKVRSQSAPKQRPEPAGTRRRLPLSEAMVESRASLSGVGMQRSCSKAQEAFSFKSAVVGKLDRSLDFGRETERDFYLHRKW